MAQPKILLTRIDDRFIYGQDVELWNEAVGSNLVLIVNDEIAADSRQWAPMRVAAPEGVWTRFFSVQRTIDIIHTATPRQWILIMVASPADAQAVVVAAGLLNLRIVGFHTGRDGAQLTEVKRRALD